MKSTTVILDSRPISPTALRLVHSVAFVGSVSCLFTIAFTLAYPQFVQNMLVQWSPWFLGLFVVGIPHGALDHRVGLELGNKHSSTPAFAAGPGFYVAYLAAAGLVLAAWFAWPIAAFSGFLVIAAIHFGQGDLYWSHQFGLAARSGSVGYRALLLLTRALLPIALPFMAFPGELSGPTEHMVNGLFRHGSFSIDPEAIGVGLYGLAAIVGLQIFWACWLARSGGIAIKQAAALDVFETLILVAMFGIVPPVLALGVYFNAWHSLRHLARLLLTTKFTRELVESGQWPAALGNLYKKTLPMTFGALLLMVIVACLVGRFEVSVASLGLLALVGLSMLTLPHVLVVTWMDERQGIWSSLPDPDQ